MPPLTLLTQPTSLDTWTDRMRPGEDVPLKLVHPNGVVGGGGGTGNSSPSSPIGRKSPNFEMVKSAKDRSRTFQVTDRPTNQPTSFILVRALCSVRTMPPSNLHFTLYIRRTSGRTSPSPWQRWLVNILGVSGALCHFFGAPALRTLQRADGPADGGPRDHPDEPVVYGSLRLDGHVSDSLRLAAGGPVVLRLEAEQEDAVPAQGGPSADRAPQYERRRDRPAGEPRGDG
mmetsp:Transcript_72139/g.204868  ORF Transcript_72139/g.204868 Transcript_72139/m.204868 type:complete len:230 (+) Transcript_72139:396-1085(+)